MTAFLLAGCASPNVNPAQPKAGNGYVDLYADSGDELYWDVRQSETASGEFKAVFSQMGTVDNGFLRLAFHPGHYRLRVTFLNRVIEEPAVVEADVQEGKVTPIHVTLVETGTTDVREKRTSVGGTAYGRYGRRTKIRSSESATYRVMAQPQPALSYRPKQEMPYDIKPSQ